MNKTITHKPWITEVEREVDEIREALQARAEKIGWDAYWKESWEKVKEELESAGLNLTRDRTTDSYLVA